MSDTSCFQLMSCLMASQGASFSFYSLFAFPSLVRFLQVDRGVTCRGGDERRAGTPIETGTTQENTHVKVRKCRWGDWKLICIALDSPPIELVERIAIKGRVLFGLPAHFP
jgi:hypothetical protein